MLVVILELGRWRQAEADHWDSLGFTQRARSQRDPLKQDRWCQGWLVLSIDSIQMHLEDGI